MRSPAQPTPLRESLIELIAFAGHFLLLVYLIRAPALYGTRTILHDNIYWNYPVYNYYIRGLTDGSLPLWNPFEHAGEPFYILLAHFRLYEPISFLVAWLGPLFSQDTLIIFLWERLAKTCFFIAGTYVLMRQFAEHLLTRLSMLPVLFLTSFAIASFRQDGLVNQFLWAPFATYYLLRVLWHRDQRWSTWIALALCIGVNFQSYFFTALSVWLLMLLAGFAAFRRDLILAALREPRALRKLSVCLALIAALTSIDLVLGIEQPRFVYPARMVGVERDSTGDGHEPIRYEGGPQHVRDNVSLSYADVVRSGVFSTIEEYIQVIYPMGMIRWNRGFIYMSVLPWIAVLLGITLGQHPLRRVWMFSSFAFAWYTLGPGSGLHHLLFWLYPPTKFFRNTESLGLFAFMSLMYFFVLGMNMMVKRYWTEGPEFDALRETSLWKHAVQTLFATLLFVPLGFLTAAYLEIAELKHHSYLIPLLYLGYGWAVSKRFERSHFWLAIIIVHTAVLVMCQGNDVPFAAHVASRLVPVFVLLEVLPRLSRRPNVGRAAFLMTAPWLVLNLSAWVEHADYLYEMEPHLKETLHVDTSLRPLKHLDQRRIAPAYARPLATVQPVRYLSILRDQTYALSSLDYSVFPPELPITSFDQALHLKRWNSMYLAKEYFALLHAPFDSSLKAQLMAVRAPIFQLKRGALVGTDAEIAAELKRLPPADAQLLLQHYALRAPVAGERSTVAKAAETIAELKRVPAPPESLQYKVTHYAPNTFDASVQSARGGVLYWADGYDRWWSATLDGKDLPIARAGYNFKAMSIPAGAHQLRFSYRPWHFLAALVVFYSTFAVGLIAMFLSMRRMPEGSSAVQPGAPG